MREREERRGLGRPDELEARRYQLKRRKKFRLLAVLILVSLTLLFAIWSIIYILASEKEVTRLAFLTRGPVGRPLESWIAFLDEGVQLTSTRSGILVPLADEGERVARDGRIALIVPPSRKGTVDRYREVKEAYEARLMALGGFADLTRHPLPLSPADGRLREAIKDLAQAGEGKDLVRSMEAFRFRFSQARRESALFAGQDPLLKELSLEKEALISLLESDPESGVIRAPVTGQISYQLADSRITYEEVREEPLRQFQELASRVRQVRDVRYQELGIGQSLLSIRRFSQETAALFLEELPLEDPGFRRGGRLDLFRDLDGLAWSACEISRLEERGGGLLIQISCDDWTGYRPAHMAFPDARILVRAQEGLRVPLACLMDLDLEEGRARLMKVSGGLTEVLPVRILAADDRYAIIEAEEGTSRPLQEADLYVVNPWTTREGTLID